ncbi:MAG: Nif3-like dinuclear metal center hexameric protein [Clostridia bacterium]|jgi:dinuclear metal center YbgI/SA1388 family protein|nr:Nif3-like dinuclear metal center hexameric protein [Clostridia bacterium]
MKEKAFVAMLDRIAPPELAMEYDNVGLLIGTEREIRTVLVALDCTLPVAEEAVRCGSDLVLVHHPLFFHGIKRILPDDPETAAAYRLIQNGIGLYAAHTNLDICLGGVNDALAETLGVKHCEPLSADGMGRVGMLETAMQLGAFADVCSKALKITVRYAGDSDRLVQRVGLCGGAGGDLYPDAVRMGCDVFVTGEMKHHEAIAANMLGLTLIEAGHYQTESVVLKKWISRLQNEENGVKYYETRMEKAPWQTR